MACRRCDRGGGPDMALDHEKIERFALGMKFIDHEGVSHAEIDVIECGPHRVVIALNFGWDGAEFHLDRGDYPAHWELTLIALDRTETTHMEDFYAMGAFMKVKWALTALVAALAP